MSARRVLIIANEAVADRPAGVPEVVRKQVLEVRRGACRRPDADRQAAVVGIRHRRRRR